MIRSFRSSFLGKNLAQLVLTLLLLFATAPKALNAATIIVGPPPASIQTAINAALPGDTIQLSTGTYIEEIEVLSKSLNIVGAGQNLTTIQAPPPSTHLTQSFTSGVNFWCIVMIDNLAAPTPQTVNISDLTVDGGTQQDTVIAPIYGSSDRFFAIGYHNANGTVQNVHTTNTRQTANFNELAGGGIVNFSTVGAVTFNVTNCLVDFYQRLGIDCRGAALTANISNNTVNRGYVLPPGPATATPNGIQFINSATGSITNNLVESNIGNVVGASATGIIPFGAGPNLVVSGNTLTNNEYGIAAITCGNNLTISNNTCNFTTTPGPNTTEGIIVQDTNGLTTLTSNIMNNMPDINMDLISSTDQPFQLMNNQFIGSQIGLNVVGNVTAGPIVTMNSDSFSGTIGYYIFEQDAPNDMWPSTSTVSFDGLISGHITLAEYNFILSKLHGNFADPNNGVILEYIVPVPPTLTALDSNSGPTTGGNTITITGDSFISSNTQVFFGTVPGTNVQIISNTELTVTVPPGTGTVDVTVSTPFGITPIVSADEYTYIQVAPLPPSNFIGVVTKNKFLNLTELVLRATWSPSPSLDVVTYRIYRNQSLVEEVNADAPLVFKTRLHSAQQARHYRLTAVNSAGLESTPVRISIVND